MELNQKNIMARNDLKFLPKAELQDGAAYEGYTDTGVGIIARWDAINNNFKGPLHSWEETRMVTFNHPKDDNEYYLTFYPMGEA